MCNGSPLTLPSPAWHLQGGGIYVSDSCELALSNCHFNNNRYYEGGSDGHAIYVQVGAISAIIQDCGDVE